MEVRREAAPPGQAAERRRPYWLAVCSAALVIAASVGAAHGTHRHRETGGTRGGDALLRPATRALHSDGESAAVDASDRSAAGARARPDAAQRDAVSKALGDVSYSKTGTAPPSISAAPSYNPTYQPSPAPSVTASPTDLPSYMPTTPGPTGVPTAGPERAPDAAAVLRADDVKALGPTDAGALAQADGLAGTDADVRADLRAHVVRAERGAVVPADDGEAERGAVRGAELHAHGGPHVLEGALRGAELRPDDGRALVEHANEAAEHVRAELRPVAAAPRIRSRRRTCRATRRRFVPTGSAAPSTAPSYLPTPLPSTAIPSYEPTPMATEPTYAPSKTPTAPSFYPTPAPARADQNPDAGAVLELLAFVRTDIATDVETVGRALVDPVAAALDADAERRADADAVAAAVRPPDAGPDVQRPPTPGPTSLPTQVPTKWQCHLSEEDFAASMQYKVYASCPWSAAMVESTPIKYSADCISPPAGHPDHGTTRTPEECAFGPCATCGHYDTCDGVWQSNATYADCVTCTEGYELDVLYDDCTGVCVPTGSGPEPAAVARVVPLLLREPGGARYISVRIGHVCPDCRALGHADGAAHTV